MQIFVLILMQVLLTPAILNLAGQQNLGAYVIFMQIVGLGLILDLGFGAAIGRYLAQSFQGDSGNSSFVDVFNTSRYLLLSTNILLSICLTAFALIAEELISASQVVLTELRYCLLAQAAWVLLRTPLLLYGLSLVASQNMAVSNCIIIFSSILRFILSYYFLFAGFGLVGLVLSIVISDFVSLTGQRLYFNRKYPEVFLDWRLPDRNLLTVIGSFGLTYWGVNVGIALTTYTDSIISAHLFGAAAASILYTTKIPTFLFIQLIYKISDNSAPAANELVSNGNFFALRSAYLKIVRYSLLLAVPLACGIIVFNEKVITAWVGKDQYAGDIASVALACYALTQVINHVNAMITLATGAMRSWMYVSVAAAVLSAVTSYLLGRFFGLQWILVSIALLDIPVLVFLVRRVAKCLELTPLIFWREIIQPIIRVAVPLVLLLSVISFNNYGQTLFTLSLCIAAFGVGWSICVYTQGLTEPERKFLLSKVQLAYTRK